MASGILIFGKICFYAMGLAIGWRLARDLRRAGGRGLHALALAAIAIGGLGIVTNAFGELALSTRVALTGDLGIRSGVALLGVFVWKTFRRAESVGVVAVVACTASIYGTFLWDVLAQPSFVDYDYGRASAQASQVGFALPFVWTAIETGLVWTRGRRRLALGLADPLVVRSFFLWTLTTSAFVALCVLAIVAGQAQHAGLSSLAQAVHLLRGLLYLMISVTIGLGLFPKAPSTDASAREPAAGA